LDRNGFDGSEFGHTLDDVYSNLFYDSGDADSDFDSAMVDGARRAV